MRSKFIRAIVSHVRIDVCIRLRVLVLVREKVCLLVYACVRERVSQPYKCQSATTTNSSTQRSKTLPPLQTRLPPLKLQRYYRDATTT